MDYQEIMDKEQAGVYQNGRGVINMTVHSDNTFLSPYSTSGSATISNDVADFLDSNADMYSSSTPLRLNIVSAYMTDTEQQLYTMAIHHYYARRLAHTTKSKNRHGWLALYMAVMGVVGFVLLVVVQQLSWGYLVIRFVEIFAWVFVWEAVDVFFIARHADNVRCKRYYHLSTMQITYSCNTDNDKLS